MKKILKMKNNSKGFTLIELLAVIVILGILMITAIPAVTKYINSSKKSTFADSAGAYINAARYSLLNDEYDCQTPAENGQKVKIPLYSCTGEEPNKQCNDVNVDIDKGTETSSYGKTYNKSSYVIVESKGGKLVYSICLIDAAGNGTKAKASGSDSGNSNCLVEEKDLGKSTISADKNMTITDSSNVSTECKKSS